MDFYFALLAIFLILDGVSIQSAEKANQVQLSAGIKNNPFLPSTPSANAQNNSSVNLLSRPFVASYSGTIGRPNSQTYNGNIFLSGINPPSPHGGSLGSGPRTRPPGTPMRISERKCNEFVGEIAGTTIVGTFSAARTPGFRLNNVCPQSNKLVVGGVDSRLGEFPHMVALGRGDPSFSLMCGGTLISQTWVLSAAHCTYGKDGGVTHARIGVFELSNSNEGTIYAIKDSIRHPDYNPPAKYADIAVVQLVDSVPFTNLVRPACLYQAYDTVPRQAWVTGWGTKEFGGENTDKLQKAHLDLVDNHACTLRHNNSLDIPHGITPTMMCAASSGKDACQGDSGGPLQTLHETSCLFQVIGITSFGRGCAQLNFPGVYTRVSHYIPWIESHVWP